ncbi:MAG: hypothetical protein U5L96_19230 [Owenweeksia sp.]|nr:hypothetical protein [Owenweeksia sp.]
MKILGQNKGINGSCGLRGIVIQIKGGCPWLELLVVTLNFVSSPTEMILDCGIIKPDSNPLQSIAL